MKKKTTTTPKSKIAFAPLLPSAVSARMKEAERYAKAGDRELALDILAEIDREYPGHEYVLNTMFQGALLLQDNEYIIIAAEGLARLRPDQPEPAMDLCISYATGGYPLLCVKKFQDFVVRFPAFKLADAMQQAFSEMKEFVPEALGLSGLGTGEEALWAGALLDEARLRLDQGNFDEARSNAEKVSAAYPTCVPALLIVISAYESEDRRNEAIPALNQILELEPENVGAFADMIHYHVLNGNLDQARSLAEHAKKLTVQSKDDTFALMKALAFLGDDEGVMGLFECRFPWPVASRPRTGIFRRQAPVEEILESERALTAVSYHFAAVSACRLDREDDAVTLWNHALEIEPNMDRVSQNLDDLALVPSEQNGPFAFTTTFWLPEKVLTGIEEELNSFRHIKRERVYLPALSELLDFIYDNYPETLTLIPSMLDRGDPRTRRIAMLLASYLDLPESGGALRDFALGRRGTDAQRWAALCETSISGLFVTDTVRFWKEGKWTDVRVSEIGTEDLRRIHV